MKKLNLVILKGQSGLETETVTFKPNKPYRCMIVGEDNIKQYLVYGVVMDEGVFNNMFEPVYEKVIRDWDKMKLTKNGSKVTKKHFNEVADIHIYGRGNNAFKIVFFSTGRDCTYGFYTMKGNKKETLKEAYEMYVRFLNGDMADFDCGDIQFGNCGIPITYTNMRTIPNIKQDKLF